VQKLDPTLNLVSIALDTVPNFPGRKLSALAPTRKMLKAVKLTGDTETYTRDFLLLLSKLDVHAIARELGEDAILVCYEKIGSFCHRHLVSDWLRAAGYSVTELLL
jgi:hypothetical protein